ncbi:MAG: cell division protein FtsZ [Gammaproteobacteria bacterium]|jgi:cell division protein FtsZ|nr:cell division protein FtsZ [Gammaproteobacteria bacterium]MBT4462729.1 cell division protein FtsZ [Gammaproteobacteria bacterium]MBT4654395.1 cell division protein FtsZ [Gammaproteobacteria bacterium]MBT5116306.1 cell division protein FtsZ [Gammaproteobacteria bacterium]MBT5761856.1 cell division protein FtsZ [Gammaproteobacteria bacterium]
MFELVNEYNQNAVIKVIGVGGGGGNAVMSMLESKIHGAEFILANTDSQALRDVKGATMIQIGSEVTKGLGAGADPEKGRQAALEAKEELASAIEGADMLFIAAGMGGGTGTGAASVIAQIARDAGILTVAVVTKPYEFEGAKRMLHAEQGIEALSEWVDSLIVIPNEKLSEVFGGDNSIFSSFENANDVLRGAVKGIAEIITIRGFINVDFADVKTVMSGRGKAMMGSGCATGDNRAEEAVQAALNSPLLDNIDLHGASGVLVNITAGANLTSNEFGVIGERIKEIANENATVIVGCIKEEDSLGELRVTLIATGFEETAEIKVEDNSSHSQINALSNDGIVSTTSDTSSSPSSYNSVVTSNTVIEKGEMDNVDIPAFLRQQAD